jgi:hypothetical protein
MVLPIPSMVLDPSTDEVYRWMYQAGCACGTVSRTARLFLQLKEIECNCKNVHVTAFLDLGTSERGGDAASRRVGEIECNITSTPWICDRFGVVFKSRLFGVEFCIRSSEVASLLNLTPALLK